MYRTRNRGGHAVALTTAAVLGAFLTVAPVAPAAPAQAQPGCLTAEYRSTDWSSGPDRGGFTADLTLANTCAEPVDGWMLALTLPTGHTFSSGWSADWRGSGPAVTAAPLGWNRVIGPGQSTGIGFVGSWLGAPQDPLSCLINAAPCDGGDPPENQPPAVTLTSPEEGFADIAGCAFDFAAEASDPDGSIDRVEFYVNDQLVATDHEAPYEREIRPNGPIGDNTAFARAFDDGDPALSTDSAPVTFVLLVPPPSPPGQDPCRSGVPPVPPEVSLTSPADGEVYIGPCGATLAARAVPRFNPIDRVEFYVNDVLVGTDHTVPYQVHVEPGTGPVDINNVAYARAFDTTDPPLIGQSAPVSFQLVPPPPVVMVFGCPTTLAVPAGGSATVSYLLDFDQTTVDLTVTGDPGISVSPTSFTLDNSRRVVTVSAAPGSAGATATIKGFSP